jgi:shikimate dehydrogenase
MRAAVLGSPVAHSLSPVLHRAAYAYLHLDWTYDAVECDEAALAGFVAGLSGDWAGLSLTMPLKTAVLGLLDEADEPTRLAGAANTLLLREGRRVGANTDVPGMVAALAERGVVGGGSGRATVLGAGATARSAVVSLAEAGYVRADVVARRPAVAADVVATGAAVGVQVRVHDWPGAAGLLRNDPADLVVCTVPRGAADALAAAVPPRPSPLFDVLYDPWPTPLAAAWEAAGGLVVGGLDLLVHQAVGQVRLMTGCAAGADELVAVLRPAGRGALAAR